MLKPTVAKYCEKCEVFYMSNTSSASLPLQYCSIFCEIGQLGFSLEALEKNDYIFRKDVIPKVDKSKS